MSSVAYPFPVAVSQIEDGEDSREAQNARAISWLLRQPGGAVAVVTPQRRFSGEGLARLLARPGVVHLTWRGLSIGSLHRRRVLHAWPDRQHLNDLWGVDADALAVIEWGEAETAEWIGDANPVHLLPGRQIQPHPAGKSAQPAAPLPDDVATILEHTAGMAAGYTSGMKWNEEDKLKADMMNRPRRWAPVTVAQVRAKCHELGMRPNDIDTVAVLLQRRKDGHRFNVRGSYRDFHFRDGPESSALNGL